jgi:hypothetical protein
MDLGAGCGISYGLRMTHPTVGLLDSKLRRDGAVSPQIELLPRPIVGLCGLLRGAAGRLGG